MWWYLAHPSYAKWLSQRQNFVSSLFLNMWNLSAPRFPHISGVLKFLWWPMTLKCCFLWINWLESRITSPSCSRYFCFVLCQNQVWNLFPYSFFTDSWHHRAGALEFKVLFMYKLWLRTLFALRSVEVLDPAWWHLSAAFINCAVTFILSS